MKNKINPVVVLVVGTIFGSLLTLGLYSLFDNPSSQQDQAKADKNEPLYWVAPMDANYKRDKPGKSPMGMDLIPVYAESDSAMGAEHGPGTIKISPEVVNNLGVRTVAAERRSLQTQIETVGYVKYDEDQLIHIHPRVQGWVEKLYVKASGDPVRKGQPLYDIYSPELVNAQEELVLALDRKNDRLIKAAEDRLRALQLPVEAINQVSSSRKVAQTVTFYAPQGGVIDDLNIREGFFAKPGTTLMSIGKLDQVWVEAEVFERQVSDVAVDLPVTMSLSYLPGRIWQGKVDYIYPTLNAKNRTVKVRLRFDNKDHTLKPNMFAQVTIHSNTAEDSLLIPKEAVIRSGSFDRVVLALGDGRFKSVKVKVGRFDIESAEILSGLEEGEKVVSSAQFLLDSESSKSSDFKRMSYQENEKATVDSVWVEATIHRINRDQRIINLAHPAIEDWNWPAMTMDFNVAGTVNVNQLLEGMTLHVEITKSGTGDYQISNIHVPDNAIGEMNLHDHHKNQNADSASSATASGMINSIITEQRMLNISRGPVAKWNRPAATLDFIADKTINMDALKKGMEIKFTFHLQGDDFIITDVHVLPPKSE